MVIYLSHHNFLKINVNIIYLCVPVCVFFKQLTVQFWKYWQQRYEEAEDRKLQPKMETAHRHYR